MLCCHRQVQRLTNTSAAFLVLVFVAGCASLRSTSSNRLDQQIAQADAAYRTLNADHVTLYNKTVASIAQQIDGETPNELRTQLDSVHVKLDLPKIELPLARYHLVARARLTNESAGVGIPMLLDYHTSHAPLYPRAPRFAMAPTLTRSSHSQKLVAPNSNRCTQLCSSP